MPGRIVADMLGLLDLEELDNNLYRGYNERASRDRPALFGGQVAAQALKAAAGTVPDGRVPHSLHGYFFVPGGSNTRSSFRWLVIATDDLFPPDTW
jgi:acyl-CoA thioesterase-2